MPLQISIFGETLALNWQLGALVGIVFLAGIIRGFAGFGSALLAVPALAVLYGPVEAIVIEVLIEIPISLLLLRTTLRECAPKTVVPMLILFAIFVPVGALLLRWVDPAPLVIGIPILVLVMLVVLMFQRRLAAMLSPGGVILTGAICGVIQGLTAIAGPLFATALMARGKGAAQTRANLLALSGGIISLSVISYVALGLVDGQTVLRAGVASPAILIGVVVGNAVFNRFRHVNLRPILLILLALTSLATLAKALA